MIEKILARINIKALLFFVALVCLVPQTADAAVAYDAFSSVTATTTSTSFGWTHTPAGTPRAVLVLIHQNAATTDQVTSVTYGGTAMTEIGTFNCDSSGETGCMYGYFLGSSIPTGARQVLVTVSSNASKSAGVVTLTGAADTWVVGSDTTIIVDTANPSVTLSLNSRTSFAAIGFHSGQNAPTGITPLTNWTSRLEFDYTNQNFGFYTYNTIASTDVTAGYTSTIEDAAMFAVAITELSAPIISTDAASSITSVSAILNGQITGTGGTNSTVRGFAWGTSSTLSNGDTSTTTETGSFGVSSFTNTVSGLIAGRTYYFRAYATNSTGTGFDASSPILSFTASAADTTISRKMRLFQGYRLKMINSRTILHQR